MYLLDEIIYCKKRSDRFELHQFYDCHIGKRNCDEKSIMKQRQEILRQSQKSDRQVRVVMGGDIIDVIKPQDIRFDMNEVADWFLQGTADEIRDKLNDIAKKQVERAVDIFNPIKHLIIGNLEANHDRQTRRKYNTDTHRSFCEKLGILDMTDEAIIRFTFKLPKQSGGSSSVVKLYMRHGYGSGRSAGAEPNKIAQMMLDGVGQDCDIAFSGHTHTFCAPIPLPVLYIPNRGKMPPQLFVRYRYGANPGCWLLSHKIGKGTYESSACYPSRAIMTLKVVIWPFWHTTVKGVDFTRPKIEIRCYSIL